MKGTWSIAYSASTACLYIAMGTTNVTISAGFVSGQLKNAIHMDTPAKSIIENVPSYFVAHANTLPCPGQIQTLNIYENANLIWATSAKTRYNCGYEKYFGMITCSQLAAYYYKIYGIDEHGYQFQRTDTLNCVGNIFSI